jgi:hypothetical protein
MLGKAPWFAGGLTRPAPLADISDSSPPKFRQVDLAGRGAAARKGSAYTWSTSPSRATAR